MTLVSAHELVQTVPCKIRGCEENAENRFGRYARLCSVHKREAMAATRDQAVERRRGGEVVHRAAAVVKAARKLEHAEELVDAARLEFRTEWLLLGAAAGVLPTRRPLT
jgi:hypothetical protein